MGKPNQIGSYVVWVRVGAKNMSQFGPSVSVFELVNHLERGVVISRVDKKNLFGLWFKKSISYVIIEEPVEEEVLNERMAVLKRILVCPFWLLDELVRKSPHYY